MSNLVEDIVTQLESEFTAQLALRRSVVTIDGDSLSINSELWKESPILRAHAVNGISRIVLASSKNALIALNKAHQDGSFPNDIHESYEVLAAAVELKLEKMTSKCFDHLRTLKALDESADLPPKLPVDTVMRVLKVFLDAPPRTCDVYKRLLSRIARYCANNEDVMTNATNLLKQSLGRFNCMGLEGVPATFEARTVPVAIYKRKGELQTAVILGTVVKPVNLFGNHFNWEAIPEHNFYLKYGMYLLFWRGGNVYHKKLQTNTEPEELLSNCYIFATRGQFVFAVQDQNNCRSIYLWDDDEKFEKIYQSEEEILWLQFDYDTGLLALELSHCKVLLFKLENKTLFLLEEREHRDVVDVQLSGRNMFLVRHDSEGSRIETHCIAAIGDDESGQSTDGQAADEFTSIKLENPIQPFSLAHFGDSYFLYGRGRLELVLDFPSLEKTRTLMTEGELVALSEMWVSP